MTQGLFQSVHSNSISYDYYRSGYAVWGFNLNASGEAPTDPLMLPMARSGWVKSLMFALKSEIIWSSQLQTIFFRFIKARIRFNKPPNQSLSLLILSETTEVMALAADGTVILSYKEPVQKI